MALSPTSQEVTTTTEKSIPWPSKLMRTLPRCSPDVCAPSDGLLDGRSFSEASEATCGHGREQQRPVQVKTAPKFIQRGTNLPRCPSDGPLDGRSFSEASEATCLHGREQQRPVQVETLPKFSQCGMDDFSSSQRSFALMIYGLPYEYRCRDVLDVLASHGIAKEEVSVRRRFNRGYCHVLFQDEGQALRFADRASGQPFPNSTKRLAIRPTVKQDIWHYVVPTRRHSDHVVMALPGKDDMFVKIKPSALNRCGSPTRF